MEQHRFGRRFAPRRHGHTVAWGAVFTVIVTFLHPSPSWGDNKEVIDSLMEQVATLRAQIDVQRELIVSLEAESQAHRGLLDTRAADIQSVTARLNLTNARLARLALRIPPLGGSPEIVAADLTGRLSEIQAVASLAPDEFFVAPTVALQALETEIQPLLAEAASQLQFLDPATLSVPPEFYGSLLPAVDELNAFILRIRSAMERAQARGDILILRLRQDESRGTTATVDYLADSAAMFLQDALVQVRTLDALESRLAIVELNFDDVGVNVSMADLTFQMILQRRQQSLQILSNVLKALHEAAMNVIRNIR